MKNNLIVSCASVFLAFLFSFSNAFAFGSISLVSQEGLPAAVINVNYVEKVDFVYSGDNTPAASLVKGKLPIGTSLGGITSTRNGVDSLEIGGTPRETGYFSFTVLLTDNHGATLTQDYTLNVIGNSMDFSNSLPNAIVNQKYTATTKMQTYGNTKLLMSYSGEPAGISIGLAPTDHYNSYSPDNYYKLGAESESSLLTFSGTPKTAGDYQITFNITSGSIQATKTINLNVVDPNAQQSASAPVVAPVQSVASTPAPVVTTSVKQTSLPTKQIAPTQVTVQENVQIAASTTPQTVHVSVIVRITTFLGNIFTSIFRWF